MQLILVRHGEAERQTRDDAARSLTERGQRQADWTATQILARYQPEHLVVSPLKRAKQTLQAFSKRLPDVPLTVLDCIKPDDDAALALAALAKLQAERPVRCVLVVCHMNVIAQMAALLQEDRPEGFELAEARVFEQALLVPAPILTELSVEQWRCVPPFLSLSLGSE